MKLLFPGAGRGIMKSPSLANHLLLALVALSVFFSSSKAINFLLSSGSGDPWTVGDWLIDYSGGFVRRGLSGEVIATLAEILRVERVSLTMTLQITLLVGVILFAFILLAIRKISLNLIVLFGSPSFLLFALDPAGIFRKELLLVFLMGLVAVVSHFFPVFARSAIVILVIVFPLLVLAHEGLFFFTPVLLLFGKLLATERKIPNFPFFAVPMSLGAFIAFLISSLFSGTQAVSKGICTEVLKSGAEPTICEGAISWLSYSPEFALNFVLDWALNPVFIPTYLVAIVLSSAPFMFFRWPSSYTPWLIAACISVLPLLAVSSDWGRWIHTLFALLSILVLRFRDSPYLGRNAPLTISSTSNVPQYFLATSFLFSWSLPHCCPNGIGPGMIGELVPYLSEIGARIF